MVITGGWQSLDPGSTPGRSILEVKMEDCVFCKILKGEVPAKKYYEDEHAFAFLDNNPVNIGHTLVVPKKHFKTIDKMDKLELNKLSEAILKISRGIMKIADGLNIQQNNGKVSGQAVPHVHFHLIPRYKDDGYKFDWKLGKPVTEKHNNDFLKKIKSFLK